MPSILETDVLLRQRSKAHKTRQLDSLWNWYVRPIVPSVLLLGQDPLFVERLWDRMYRSDRGIKRQGIAAYAISALDIGLWDIVGKAANLPLFKLWGAVTDRVPTYGSGGWPAYTIDDVVAEALRYKAAGCRYYKMKIHDPDPHANRRRVELVRRALGEGVRLSAVGALNVLGHRVRVRRTAVHVTDLGGGRNTDLVDRA